MSDGPKSSPLLLKYLEAFEKNPKSQVFAPLAETYRKLGQVDQALKILREGIKKNPNYLMGYITLANVYYDTGKFELGYSTLRPLVANNLDNLMLQKLFAQLCLRLDFNEEALETFKYILFLNPKDELIASEVKRLELMLEDEKLVETVSDNELTTGSEVISDDWVTVDMTSNETEKNLRDAAEDNFEEVELSSIADESDEIAASKAAVDDDESKEEKELTRLTFKETNPLITHTLVDLYLKQGHIKKAYEILQKMMSLGNGDEVTTRKYEEVLLKLRTRRSSEENESEEVSSQLLVIDKDEEEAEETGSLLVIDDDEDAAVSVTEDEQSTVQDDNSMDKEGRDDLMAFFDAKLGPKQGGFTNEAFSQIETRFNLFLDLIKKRSLYGANFFL